MELTHSFTVPTSVDDAWSLFMDLERVGNCFPGATVTEATDEGFTGTVKVKLGPISLLYAGSGSFIARDDEGHRAVIEAKGKDKRGNGTAGATVTIQLVGEEDGTRADVVTDLAVTGKPAQFGRGVMQDVSDKLLMAFVACIEKQLSGQAPEAVAAPTAAATVIASSEAAPSAVAPEAAAEPVRTATVQDAGEAAARPEIVKEAVPAAVTETGKPLTLEEDVELNKAEAAAATAKATFQPRSVPAPGTEDDALDLGSTVLPVLARRYGGYVAAAAVGLLIGWLLGRR